MKLRWSWSSQSFCARLFQDLLKCGRNDLKYFSLGLGKFSYLSFDLVLYFLSFTLGRNDISRGCTLLCAILWKKWKSKQFISVGKTFPVQSLSSFILLVKCNAPVTSFAFLYWILSNFAISDWLRLPEIGPGRNQSKVQPTTHLLWEDPRGFLISIKFRSASSHFRFDHFYIIDFHSALTWLGWEKAEQKSTM